jgi:hypothetical protein
MPQGPVTKNLTVIRTFRTGSRLKLPESTILSLSTKRRTRMFRLYNPGRIQEQG